MKYCKQCGIELHKGNSTQNEKQSSNYCDDCEDDFIDGDLYEDFDS